MNAHSNNSEDMMNNKVETSGSYPKRILLPSTVGIPSKNGASENRLRDPRIFWAPAISISGRNDRPLITPQYQRKQQFIAEKIEQVKLNKKVTTNVDLSHLTRLGSDKTRLPISFIPHKTIPSRKHLSVVQGPGPTSYQRYRGYDQIGEEYIYTRQPHVVIHSLIGPKLKRERHVDGVDTINFEKKKIFQNIKPFWITIGTRTQNSRLPNAPVITIHPRLDMTLNVKKTDKLQEMSMPGPAMYPIISANNEIEKRYICRTRGTTIAPRYHENHFVLSGPGPAMIERELLEKGYKNTLKKAPAFSISSRWSPYSHTYTDECSDNFF